MNFQFVSLLRGFVVASSIAFVPCRAEPNPATRNEELGREILSLFHEDQKALTDFNSAKSNPEFARSYETYKGQVLKTHPAVFHELSVKELWASKTDCPVIVLRLVQQRKKTTERIQSIISERGWPRRDSVGDEAAAAFFFLFGHADTSNTWRRTQLPTILQVFREDHVNPRLYAHLVDRVESVDAKPQIFGTVMGPGKEVGTAELYRPLSDSREQVEQRRAEIGLPSIESDLEKFRTGAKIGPYMTPLTGEWSLGEVYKTAVLKP